MKDIKFYKISEPYGEFSNFSASPIVIASQIWPTVEHYFQASKFNDYLLQDRIMAMSSPMEAAKEGRNRDNILREDWEEVKDKIMYKAVKAKFLQLPHLRSLLLKTGDSKIIEHTTNDSYWGDGGDGSGKNMLGIILMTVREELIKISDDPDLILPPWIAFPSLDQTDMFWRMGIGERYLIDLFNFMGEYGEERYKNQYPEPDSWIHFYREK